MAVKAKPKITMAMTLAPVSARRLVIDREPLPGDSSEVMLTVEDSLVSLSGRVGRGFGEVEGVKDEFGLEKRIFALTTPSQSPSKGT